MRIAYLFSGVVPNCQSLLHTYQLVCKQLQLMQISIRPFIHDSYQSHHRHCYHSLHLMNQPHYILEQYRMNNRYWSWLGGGNSQKNVKGLTWFPVVVLKNGRWNNSVNLVSEILNELTWNIKNKIEINNYISSWYILRYLSLFEW